MAMQLVPSIYVGMKQVPHLIQYARRQYATYAFRKSKGRIGLTEN